MIAEKAADLIRGLPALRAAAETEERAGLVDSRMRLKASSRSDIDLTHLREALVHGGFRAISDHACQAWRGGLTPTPRRGIATRPGLRGGVQTGVRSPGVVSRVVAILSVGSYC